jgi:hypothetical protein
MKSTQMKIHRQVICRDAMNFLATVRVDFECTRRHHNTAKLSSIEMGGLRMACSSACYFIGQSRKGAVPLDNLPSNSYQIYHQTADNKMLSSTR